jgi:hypothetical protein
MDSAKNPKAGVISEPVAGFWGTKCARFVMTLTPVSTAAIRTMKMMRLQPARRPSAPMKILRRVNGSVAASWSWLDESVCALSGSFLGRFYRVVHSAAPGIMKSIRR